MLNRIISFFLLAALFTGGLSQPAANAIADGTIACGTSGSFTIASNVVTGNTDCVGSVNIPIGVTSIGVAAFINSNTITTVTIPEGVTTIEFVAFASTPSLHSVSLPSTLVSIGQQAFAQSHLSSIELPEGLVTIGVEAFYNTPLTGLIAIPNSVRTIATYAFAFTQPTYLRLGTGVTSIGAFAFTGQSTLAGVSYCGLSVPAIVSGYAYNNSLHPVCRALVRFDANGGAGHMASLLSFTNTTITPNAFTRSGYTFDDWSTTANGAKVYSDAAAFTFVDGTDVKLVARWIANVSPEPSPQEIAIARAKAIITMQNTLISKYGAGTLPSLSDYISADFTQISLTSVGSVNGEMALFAPSAITMNTISKIVNKYYVVERFSTPETCKLVYPADLINIGVIPAGNLHKTEITLNLRKLSSSDIDTYSELNEQAQIQMNRIDLRQNRLRILLQK